MKHKLLIFDLDGTILNTLEDLSDSVNYSLKLNQLATHTIDEVKMMIGNGIKCLIKRAIPKEASLELYQKVYDDFVEYYTNHCTDKTKPYNNIKECLQKLKENELILCVNTNKNENMAKKMCDYFFPNIFSVIVGSKEGTRPKPQTDGVKEILKSLEQYNGLNKLSTQVCFSKKNKTPSWYSGKCLKKYNDSVVYVGDTEVDIQTGKNAGINTIGVSWGFRDKNFLEHYGATKVVDTPDELFKYIVE